MPGAVAAVGAAAGSVAGSALMNAMGGGQSELKVDTNIPGVTSATVQKSTKGSAGIEVAQVDPTQAIDYFKQAATSSEGYYKQGLDLYSSSINAAIQTVNASYAQSNATLYGQAQAGIQALNQELSFMGLTPISQSAGLTSVASSIGNYPELQAQMTAAENIQDPAARATAKAGVLSTINGLKAKAQEIPPEPAIYQAQPYPKNGAWVSRQGLADYKAAEQAKVVASQQAHDQWAAQAAEITKQNTQLAATNASLDQLATQYSNQYSDTYQGALTSDQIQQQLENTPGYQFNLNQGIQASDRSASAKGMLNSGNASIAAIEYGQNLASNTFQNAMANLASIASQGLPANTQIAANQVNQGSATADLLTNLGAAAANTYTQIGNQYASAYTNAGQATYNAAQYNAQAQNEAMAAKRTQDAKTTDTAISSGAGYLNAQTASNQLAYQAYQGSALANTLATPTSYNIVGGNSTTTSL